MRHHKAWGQHENLSAEIDILKLTQPAKDTNQLHVISGHRGHKQMGHILFVGIITGKEFLAHVGRCYLPLKLFVRYVSTFFKACWTYLAGQSPQDNVTSSKVVFWVLSRDTSPRELPNWASVGGSCQTSPWHTWHYGGSPADCQCNRGYRSNI